MKYTIIILLLLIVSGKGWAQDADNMPHGDSTDLIYIPNGVMWERFTNDTIPVVMLILDMQLINGKWDNRPFGLKGYRVNGDYETYYLDISKKRLPKNIIVWLDQNL